MRIEWTDGHVGAEYTEERGVFCDDFGSTNDGVALQFDNGAGGGLVIEAKSRDDLLRYLVDTIAEVLKYGT